MVLHHMSEGRSGFALQYGALHPGGPPYLRGHPLGPSPCPRRRGIRHPDGHGDRGGRAHGLTYSPESCRASPLRHRRDNSSTSRFAEPLASAPASGTKMRSERSSRPERRSPTGVLPRPVARVVPANVPHRVDRGGPAEAPATDPLGGCAREGLGHGGGAPVDRRAEQPRPRLGYRDQLRLLYGAGFDTRAAGSVDRRLASTLPAEPPPTTIQSYDSVLGSSMTVTLTSYACRLPPLSSESQRYPAGFW